MEISYFHPVFFIQFQVVLRPYSSGVDDDEDDNNDEKDGRVPTWLPQMTKQPMKRRMYCADILMEMHILSLYYDYDLTLTLYE